MSFSWLERLYSHMGAEKHPTVGSSGEYWSINYKFELVDCGDERFIES